VGLAPNKNRDPTGGIQFKQEKLRLTVTSAFLRVKELRFDVCHEKAKWMLGLNARCLFVGLARAINDHKRNLPNFQSEY